MNLRMSPFLTYLFAIIGLMTGIFRHLSRQALFQKKVLLLIPIIIVALLFFRHSSAKPTDDVQVSDSVAKAVCTRTARLENEPQYDRALSLIAQRIENSNKYSYDENKFKYFSTNLTNCIKVVEAKLDKGTEGYFILNGKDIKPNYFPITIDTSYYLTDDALTALLLTHEVTHVQQYIDSVNGKTKLSCLDNETSAFMAQLDFYVDLNTEENKSVWLRMQEKDDLHPQVQMIKNMIQINQERDPALCDFLDKKCRDAYLRVNLKKLISEDDRYKHECEENSQSS